MTAQGYAAPVTSAAEGAPLAVDPTALPLSGRHGRAARTPRRSRVTLKAAAEAPKTKIIAGPEADEAASKPEVRPRAAVGKSKAAAAKPSAIKAPQKKTALKAAKPEPKKPVAKKAEPKKVAAKGKAKGSATN